MQLRFDEIMVGERGRAHDVLATSLPMDVAKAIAHHLDLPGQLPPGFDLRDYVSGFPHADLYVIARTSLDSAAGRQGMVFSHALVSKTDALANLSDIEPVFERLVRSRPESLSAFPVTVEAAGTPPGVAPLPEFCDMLGSQAHGPVVVGEPQALEGVVSAVWSNLLPAIRGRFRFRLSFGPEEHDVASFHVVAVPSPVVTRWPPARVLNLDSSQEAPKTPPGRFLHSANAREDLISFLDDLSVSNCDGFKRFAMASHALELWRSEPDFDSTLSTLRLIGGLQPDPSKGVSVKRPLLERLGRCLSADNEQGFLALRNLDLAPFPDPSTFLGDLGLRFKEFIEANESADTLATFAQSAFDPSRTTGVWRDAFLTGLGKVSSNCAATLASQIHGVLSASQDAALYLLEHVGTVPAMDHAMARALRKPVHMDGEALSETLIGSGLLHAEAQALINSHNGVLADALRDACARDRYHYGKAAIEYVLQAMRPSERVAAGLGLQEPLVRTAAAAAVAVTPSLLDTLPLGTAALQEVWAQALDIDHGAWRVSDDVGALRRRVFGCMLDGRLSSSLLDRLVASPLGNLLDYPRRADVWQALPSPSREKCLTATAHAWVDALPNGASDPRSHRLEPELCAAIASPGIRPMLVLSLGRLDFAQQIDVFAGNPSLPGALFGQFLDAYAQARRTGADRIPDAARLVADRGWKDVTRRMWERHRENKELADLFLICIDHLDPWDRFKHKLRRPTTDDLFRLFVGTACELYPAGPMESAVWERAGGDPAGIDVSGPGKSQWEVAVRKLRRGASLRPSDLVATMREDYPRNEKLAFLSGRL